MKSDLEKAIIAMGEILKEEGETLDSFDNELNATEIAVIDELASAAELVMKKTIDVPIAIIRGVDYKSSKLNASELIRDDNEDFFL